MPPEPIEHDAGLPDRLLPLLLFFVQRRWLGSLCLLILPASLSFVVASIGDATRGITDAVLSAAKNGGDMAQAAHGPLLHFVLLIGSTFVIRLGMWTTAIRTRMPLMADMRTALFGYIQRHDPLYFENNLSGKIAHKAAILPDQMMTTIERTWYDFVPGATFFATVSAYYFTASPWFAAFVVSWLVVYFANILRISRHSAAKAARYNDAKTQLTGRLVDVITNIRNVIVFANNTEEDRRLGEAIRDARDRHTEFYRAMVRLRIHQHLLNMTMWIGLYGLATYEWTHGRITPGDFVMVTSLGSMLLNRAQDIGELIPDVLDNIGSAREGIETLMVERHLTEAPDARPLKVASGEIRFEDIAFAYENGRPIFEGLSLIIPAGQRVGLIGMSGAGKSTLVALLMRLHDVQGGRVLIDGQDVKMVTHESLRRAIGLIPQDTQLFHRTLMDNIRYGDPAATDATVIEAARRSFADEFIDLLPKKYGTMVGERGVKLSGGQRQRIAIARAFVKNAPILVLDEATSALDSESEGVIQVAMQNAMQGRTVIAIAHRLSTIAHLDRLIVLEDGRVVEDGTHEALLDKGGVYAQLWRRQSGGFLKENVAAKSENAIEARMMEIPGDIL
jgi:ABC-type multidrug transport system fused ATPase/permease subunit